MSVNVPSTLVNWLSTFTQTNTLLIHLSTDQVYQGTKSFYKEDDETLPVNVYGKSKVAAEEFISRNYSNFVILRSSIIFGPQTISPLSKSLPIQWMDGVLAKGQAAEFFHGQPKHHLLTTGWSVFVSAKRLVAGDSVLFIW